MAGIVETKQAFVAVNEIGVYLAGKLKNGFQLSDATDFVAKLVGDAEFQKVLKDAIEGATTIPDELGDIDLAEGLELATLALSYVPKYVEALKNSSDAGEAS